MDCSKGRKTCRFVEMRQGSFGLPNGSVLSETAGAREERKFLNGLIL